MEIIGAIFIIAFGTLGHFIFEWSGHRKCAGIFFAVNESTWEHIKLAIYPTLIWGIAEIVCKGWSSSIPVATAAATISMMVLIPATFYGYTSIVGKNFLIADITCFIASVVAGMFVFKALLGIQPGTALEIIAYIALAAIITAYFTLSYHPLHNFLFKDPISGNYGPSGHDCNSDFHGVHREHSHTHHNHSH